ncbi:MAG: PASTA domain-containing protein [Turicibacter sp.]|nr:PASTA domain-containing protein [Turicibacter sp.]
MSKKGDFLTGFSGGNTQKPLTEQNETPVTSDKPTETKKTEAKKTPPAKGNSAAENKKLADKIVAEDEKKANARVGTASRPPQNENAIIKAPEHTVTKDEKFHQRKLVKYGVIGAIALVAIVVIFFLFRILTSVEVRNWVGMEFREAQQFEVLNPISIDRIDEYSLYPEGQIIDQSHEPGSNLARGAVLTLTVSRGPDMNEIIELPDFEEMTASQIRTWRLDYQVMSVTVRDEASSDVENHGFIRMEVPSDVDINNFRRSDSLTIYVSSGPERVQMENFMGNEDNTREAVESWAAANPGINVNIVDEASETVERDIVIRQSAPPNANLAEGDEVTIVISTGSPIIVPNFANVWRDEADAAGPEGLMVDVQHRYHATVPYGRFISQSHEAGYELFGPNPSVTVIYSRNLPWVPLVGMENEIQELMFNFERHGANMTHRIDHVNHCATRGTVVSQTFYNQRVALNAHIVFSVSRGNLVCEEPDMPDFPPGGGDSPGPGDGG